jgi:hypothetical protein
VNVHVQSLGVVSQTFAPGAPIAALRTAGHTPYFVDGLGQGFDRVRLRHVRLDARHLTDGDSSSTVWSIAPFSTSAMTTLAPSFRAPADAVDPDAPLVTTATLSL